MRSIPIIVIVLLVASLFVHPLAKGSPPLVQTDGKDAAQSPGNFPPLGADLPTLSSSKNSNLGLPDVPMILGNSESGPWDFSAFLTMENPKEAASALRKHLNSHGITVNDQEPSSAKPKIKGVWVRKSDIRNKRAFLVYPIDGVEFTPAPGIEADLAHKAKALKEKGAKEERLVCILQTTESLTAGDVLQLLDCGVRFFDSVGRQSHIAQIPAEVVLEVAQTANVRWLGEYKTTYKIDEKRLDKDALGAFLYTLDGDKPEHREDLKKRNVSVLGFDTTVSSYSILLEPSRYQELADVFWWVRRISSWPSEVPLGTCDEITVNFNPEHSRRLCMTYNESFFPSGAGVVVGVRDTDIFDEHPALSGIFHPDSTLSGTTLHGTHVTGIIAGRLENISVPWGTTPIYGIAPDATVLFRKYIADTTDVFMYLIIKKISVLLEITAFRYQIILTSFLTITDIAHGL